jgi:hypothetical protein
MSDLTPIIQDDGEEDEDGVEILPPIKRPSVSMTMEPSPDIGPALTELRDRLQDVLAVPSDKWPESREIELRVQFALVPTGIKAIVRNVSPDRGLEKRLDGPLQGGIPFPGEGMKNE